MSGMEQAPTRSAVLELKGERVVVGEAYDFLDEKRLLLAAELLRQLEAGVNKADRAQPAGAAGRHHPAVPAAQIAPHRVHLFGAAAAFHVLVGGWSVVAAGLAWLADRMRSGFGRHTAPVLVVPQLDAGEAAVIVSILCLVGLGARASFVVITVIPVVILLTIWCA